MDGQKGAGRARGQGRASRQQSSGGNGPGRRPPNARTPGQQQQQSAWGRGQPGGSGQQQSQHQHHHQSMGGGGGNGGGQHQGAVPLPSAWGGQRPAGAWGGAPPAQQAPAQPRPQSGPQPQAPSQPSAWGQMRQPGPSTSAATAAPLQRHQAPQTQGRATTHRGANPPAEPARSATEDARGSVRGRRPISEFVNTRPDHCVSKKGSSGTRVAVKANYYRVLRKPRWSIFQYRIDFSPDVDMIRERRKYLYEHHNLFGGYLFDGTILFSTSHLDSPTKELYCKDKNEQPIQIKVRNVGEIKVTDIQLLQVLNLILRRSMEGLNLQLVCRNFFDPIAKILVPSHKLEIWPGYTTSIRQHEQDILLCAEVTHKIMRTDTLLQILTKHSRESSYYQDVFKKEVCGMVVLTDYNNKTYRVDDVDFEQTPMSKFTTADGSSISYMDYYKQRYQITIREPKQPLLVSRPTEKNVRSGISGFIMLIPELARATGLNEDMKSNRSLMRSIADNTRLAPEPRIERLKVFHDRLDGSEKSQAVLKSWNLKLDKELVELPGRILQSEAILFRDRKYVCDKNADWNREFRDTTMFVQKEIRRWMIIVPRRCVPDCREFVRLLHQAARGMKMTLADPRFYEIMDDRNPSYAAAVETASSNDPQLLLVVVPNDNAERYSCIKKKCFVDRAVPSQVVNMRTIAPKGRSGGLMSIATKVLIQINAKLLGAPWMIEIPLRGLMTVGFDVCHSARDTLKSYGAMVATMDLKLTTNYFSAVSEHMKGQELSTEISLNMNKAIQCYRNKHGALPERILFFRDGVGDGQLQQVFDSEIKLLKSKLDQVYKNAGHPNGVRLAFIVVSKRINTRFFVNRQNPPPGLVVDDVVTLPERYDFFLVSQSVRQGTVSPTSYNVIHDNMGLDCDRLQTLSYKMTHMYYNWSGTCRVPAVCQYAHKLAFMVAQYLHRAPCAALENHLYFL